MPCRPGSVPSGEIALRRCYDGERVTGLGAVSYRALVRLFKLDAVDEQLELLPMAARRALDAAGMKLSLEAWKRQDLELRRKLVELGSGPRVDISAVLALLTPLGSSVRPVTTMVEPEDAKVPKLVAQAYGQERSIPDASWAALSPLERYVLVKIAQGGRQERLDEAYAELIGDSALSSHLAPSGGVRMVNVGEKDITERRASVESWVVMNEEAFTRLAEHRVPKGDVFGTARVAGIMAAKRTSEWIPLCHPLRLTRVNVEMALDPAQHAVHIQATVEARDRTGVEMEALVAANAAALTIYDMLKSFDRGMQIGPTRLLQKTGGRTGDFSARSES